MFCSKVFFLIVLLNLSKYLSTRDKNCFWEGIEKCLNYVYAFGFCMDPPKI